MTDRYDIAIIGAGMAGASLAAELEGRASVIVLEAEDQPGYHATGRSAAFWTESYGGPMIQPLTTASGHFLREGGFLSPRGALTIGRAGHEYVVAKFAEQFTSLGVRVDLLSRGQLERRIPLLKADWTCGALEPDCCDIDVAALHQHYLSRARKAGAEVATRCKVASIQREGSDWSIVSDAGLNVRCRVIVNAAGAWADDIADIAGVRRIGIVPYRRTMVQLAVTPQAPPSLPLVLDIDERFYFKPESGGIWLSPHDETPSAPCDAAPEELDVAVAIDRLEQVVDWSITKVARRWAGLRSFAPDRLPVYGFDPVVPCFFWFAGQGGFGIQTAPAAAGIAAKLIMGETGGAIDPAPFSPERFA